MADWNAFVAGVTLNNNIGDPRYYRDVIANIVDASLQSWMRTARTPIRLAIANNGAQGFANDAVLNVLDNRSTISVVPCGQGSTGNADPGANDTTCDITLEAAGAGCAGSSTQTVAGPDGSGAGFYRVLRHELGHCLGLGHVCASDGSAACTGAARNPENECVAGPLMDAPTTDVAHGDDIEGIHKILRGDTVFSGGVVTTNRNGPFVSPSSLIPRRDVFLTRSTINTANQFLDSGSSNLGIDAAYLPRIDCISTTTSAAVDCVIARGYNDNEVRFNSLSFSGETPSLAGTTVVIKGA